MTAAQPALNASASPCFSSESSAIRALTSHQPVCARPPSIECSIPPHSLPPRPPTPVSMTPQTFTPKPLSATPMIWTPPSSNSLSRTLPQPSSITATTEPSPPNLTMHRVSQPHQDSL
ncbi:hypothetical protein BJX62DRAFT_207569 [Aspergillus germanicus]